MGKCYGRLGRGRGRGNDNWCVDEGFVHINSSISLLLPPPSCKRPLRPAGAAIPRQLSTSTNMGATNVNVYVGLSRFVRVRSIRTWKPTLSPGRVLPISGPPTQDQVQVSDCGGNLWVKGREGSSEEISRRRDASRRS